MRHLHQPARLALGLLAATGSVSCMPPEDQQSGLEGDPPVLAWEYPLDGACGEDNCGLNSPTVGDGVVFDELHLHEGMSQWNRGGVRIIRARACRTSLIEKSRSGGDICENQGVPVELSVRGDRLVARSKHLSDLVNPRGEVEVAGQLLVEIEHMRGGRYELYFRQAAPVPFWTTAPGTQGSTVGYEILYRMLQLPASGDAALRPEPGFNARRRICNSGAAGEEVQQEKALVFAGDHYNPRTKTVANPTGPGWFNLACQGTAPFKMHLTRHTAAGSPVPSADSLIKTPRAKTLQQRQAMLKMLTADFCGGGLSFTKNFQPLWYEDSAAWIQLPPEVTPDPGTVEAIWTEAGAVCLNTPRTAAQDPDVTSRIASECAAAGRPLARCTVEQIADWQAWGHVLSALRRTARPGRPQDLFTSPSNTLISAGEPPAPRSQAAARPASAAASRL